ncbi:MAG: peptide chain release factor N(5)-glutamine methyltransferase [Salibacteraceae bacterium]
MPNNKIESVLRYFHLKLDEIYSINEVDSFFWILLEAELNWSRIDFMKDPDLRMSESQLLTFIGFSRRLAKFEPVQYIAGITNFRGYDLKVSPNVLIPRPETEELVSWVLQSSNKSAKNTIIDIGTGSGCIPISIALELPNSKVEAIDIMPKALELAKENAIALGATVEFRLEDALNLNSKPNTFDVVISNPPYVLDSEKNEMRDNVLNFEPHVALFVEDSDPLLFYKSISKWAHKSLRNNGMLFFEINEKYAQETIQLLENIGFVNCEFKNDIFDKPRMVKGVKK